MNRSTLLSLLRLASILGLSSWAVALGLSRSHNTASLPFGLAIVVGVNLVLLHRARVRNPELGALLPVAFAYKIAYVGAFVVILLAVYGSGDAILYHTWAARYASDFWTFGQLPPLLNNSGTAFIRGVTGYFYLFAGSSLAVGMLAYGMLAFWGALYYLKAFREFFPNRDFRAMALFFFFYPSVAFWTSSIGKDALIFLFLGMSIYRLALAFKELSLKNIALLALPVAGVMIVRPHIALMLLVAACCTLLLSQRIPGSRRFVVRAGAALLFIAGIAILLPLVKQRLFLEDLTLASASEFLEWQQRVTSRGGSSLEVSDSFTTRVAKAPLMFVRPFPWEAHNLTSALAATEGVLFLAVLWKRRRFLVANLCSAREHPFVLLTVLLMIEFSVSFSSIGNFGILTRQRIMMLPLLFMLLSQPPPTAQPAAATSTTHPPLAARRRLALR